MNDLEKSQRLDALYHDVLCKCYCSIEVPSRTIEELNGNPGMKQVDAIRKVMIERIDDAQEKGIIKLSPEDKSMLVEDLRTSEEKSRNVRRIKSLIRWHSGANQRQPGTVQAPLYHRHDEFKSIADAMGLKISTLVTRVIYEWLDNQKTKGANQ